jgi:tRNA A37 threonylcarbamoyltransferase TsaD
MRWDGLQPFPKPGIPLSGFARTSAIYHTSQLFSVERLQGHHYCAQLTLKLDYHFLVSY